MTKSLRAQQSCYISIRQDARERVRDVSSLRDENDLCLSLSFSLALPPVSAFKAQQCRDSSRTGETDEKLTWRKTRSTASHTVMCPPKNAVTEVSLVYPQQTLIVQYNHTINSEGPQQLNDKHTRQAVLWEKSGRSEPKIVWSYWKGRLSKTKILPF